MLEAAKDNIIMSEISCSSDIQYCQIFSISYYEWITGLESYFEFSGVLAHLL